MCDNPMSVDFFLILAITNQYTPVVFIAIMQYNNFNSVNTEITKKYKLPIFLVMLNYQYRY